MCKYKTYACDPQNVCDPQKALATFGDVDFINCGGQLLMPNSSGGDKPYLEIIEPPSDDETIDGYWTQESKWTIYRVEPETGDQWFDEHLSEVADCVDTSVAELQRLLRSDNAGERAQAYIYVAAVYGWYEFDQYPLVLTQHEVHKRYNMTEDCQCEQCLA